MATLSYLNNLMEKHAGMLKEAWVRSIHKEGEMNKYGNYRLISLQSNTNKVFEGAIFDQLVIFLEVHGVLCKVQKKGKSTMIYYIVSVCVNLSRAFDILDHQVLLEKMKCCSIRGMTPNLFKSYLSQRTQRVIESRMNDERVSNWVTVSTPLPVLSLIFLYLLLVLKILPLYMKNRKPFDLTKLIRVYNLIQIAICAMLIYLISTSGWMQGKLRFQCSQPENVNSPHSMALLQAAYWTYLLKCLELVETVFFILRKKFNQVSNLHVYHHASTLLLIYTACKYKGSALVSFPIMLNSFTHILMYSYYFLASLGPSWQKKLTHWKPRLTIAQMIQFTILLIHAVLTLTSDCEVPTVFFLIYLSDVIVIFKMFYDFYQESYKERTMKQQ